jgi:hypothetical protein
MQGKTLVGAAGGGFGPTAFAPEEAAGGRAAR